MIITIDGPAGTGKSTVSQAVAERLGFDFLDTGAMYRAIALAAHRRNAEFADHAELAFIASHAKIDFQWDRKPPGVLLNGEPVGHLLRSGEVTSAASKIAVVAAIREKLVEQQQRIGAERMNMVTEGRDQGSVVFPRAELKFYLDATPRERARRRANQLRARGEAVDADLLLREIMERDTRDSSRAVGPLAVPIGAEVVDTTSLTQEQVVERIIAKTRAYTAI